MTNEYQLRVLPQVAADGQALRDYLCQEKGIDAARLQGVRILKRSIDARQRTIVVNLTVRVYIDEPPADDAFQRVEYPDVSGRRQVIVVGAGPAGLFAALRLIELGLRPIVLERGKDVHERKKDLAAIARTQQVDGESNYCFGEGGAGAYSDGKLYTRSKKRGDTEKILRVFCQHGASTNILADAHPHIGTDRLPTVIEAMRNTIISHGGEVHFHTKVTGLLIARSGGEKWEVGGENLEVGGEKWEVGGEKLHSIDGLRVVGVIAKKYSPTSHLSPLTSKTTTFEGPVILATGHSARDVYRYLASLTEFDKQDPQQLLTPHSSLLTPHSSLLTPHSSLLTPHSSLLTPKGIAVGVRLEHPSQLIDQIQYHRREGRGRWLPAAEYSFVTQVEGRGAYSFCMCPGGFVIPAATGPEQVVVNGMSPASRGGRWSNSGMVVEVRPEDILGSAFFKPKDGQSAQGQQYPPPSHLSPLTTLYFQEQLERLCWQQGGCRQTAPAQRMADFVEGRQSRDLPRSSYAPGIVSSPLHEWLPRPIASRLQQAFRQFGRQARGFLTNEAVLIGVETRTSSPVRITRDPQTLQSVALKGLFPCGEGAGYAGGIVSAGVDGERCAEMCAIYLSQT